MVQASRVRLAEGECSVNGCDGPVHAHGMCRSHYDRWRRSGSGARKRRMSRACLACGSFFETERRDKAFCSARCRKRFQRLKAEGAAPNRTPQPLKSVLWEPRSNARVGRRGVFLLVFGLPRTSGTRVLIRVRFVGCRLTGRLMF